MGLEGAGDGGEGAVDAAHLADLLHVRQEEAAELEDRECTDNVVILVGDGEGADVVLVDELEGLGAGGLWADLEHSAVHDVAQPRRDIAQVEGQRLVEAREDGVDAGVGVAATGRHAGGVAAPHLVIGVGDGGTDGVGIGIAVADDVGWRGHGRSGGSVRGRARVGKRIPCWGTKGEAGVMAAASGAGR